MKNLLNSDLQDLGNLVALGLHDLGTAPARAVERAADGVPTAWRLFGWGPFTITREGATVRGDFTPEAADIIVASFEGKGGKIPLDAKHFLFHLAQDLGIEESEVTRLLPDGRGTFGFAALEKRDDGLWLSDIEYVPPARALMARGVFRHFSPVVRGLSDGRLRITSVAFTNQPAIDRLDALVAESAPEPAWRSVDALAASLDAAVAASANRRTGKRNKDMDKLLAKLAALLGMDTIALSDDHAVPDTVVEKLDALAGEIVRLRTSHQAATDFLAEARGPLALSEDADLATAAAALRGLAAKAGQADDLKARVDALALEAENRKRAEVVERGLSEGKLTRAMLDSGWCKGQDAAALSAYLECAPVIVPAGDKIDRSKLNGPDPDTVALSEDDRKILAMLGVTDKAEQDAAARQ
jgi:phage I-like protein